MTPEYSSNEPKRAEVDAFPGPTVIEFGNSWCGHCRRAQPHIAAALQAHPGVRHLRIADASGRRLGRSFRVKLWPTLIFLRDGKELARLVRPHADSDIRAALARIDPPTHANRPDQ
jgi:thioredoxin 1